MLGDAAWSQRSPVALVLSSSSSCSISVCTCASDFTGALPLLSPLHLPSSQIMAVIFNVPLNMLPHSPLSCCPGSFYTSAGKRPSALCAATVRIDWAACRFASFSIQPCSCPHYGLYDNLVLCALQQPLLHHTLHLLFGSCSLPLRGLHLPHCSLDDWSYGTPHGSK